MSVVPPLSRRVLTALRPATSKPGLDHAAPTAVARAFVQVEAALEAHLTALAALDRIEEAVVTAHGYPRVPLPNRSGTPDYAADAATITCAHCTPTCVRANRPADFGDRVQFVASSSRITVSSTGRSHSAEQ